MLCDIQERVPMDGHAVALRQLRLPVQALRLHPTEGGLLQLVPRHDRPRQNHHKRHRPLSMDTALPETHCCVPNSVPPPDHLAEYFGTLKAGWSGGLLLLKKRKR